MGKNSYSRSAIALHWLLAALLAFQLGLGWRMEDMPRGPAGFAAFQLHKSIGIAILLLTLARLGIRLARPRPPLMADSAWAKALAHDVHLAFYAVLILVPLSGWVLVSTAKVQLPTLLFGLVPWPHLPVPHALHEPAEGMHGLLSLLGVGLFVAHVAGALRHQFVKDENILGRMMPWVGRELRAPRGRAALGVLMALGLVGGAMLWSRVMPFGGAAEPATAAQPSAPAEPAPLANEAAPAAPDVAPDNAAIANEAAAQEAPEPLADWEVAPGGSLGFTASWNGTPVQGSFRTWSAAIRFSPDAPEASTLRVTIDLASADTADGQRDEMLKGADFFNVASHPKAVFTASSLRALGGNRYAADGSLDLHGVTRPVSLRFTLDIAGDKARAKGAASLDRTRFGVGSGEWAATDQIAAKVDIAFAFSATRQAP